MGWSCSHVSTDVVRVMGMREGYDRQENLGFAIVREHTKDIPAIGKHVAEGDRNQPPIMPEVCS